MSNVRNRIAPAQHIIRQLGLRPGWLWTKSIVAILSVCWLMAAGAADPYGAALDQLSAAPSAESSTPGLEPKESVIEQQIVQEVMALAQGPESPPEPRSSAPQYGLILLSLALGCFLTPILLRGVRAWSDPQRASVITNVQRCAPEFLASFHEGSGSASHELSARPEQEARTRMPECMPAPAEAGKPPAGAQATKAEIVTTLRTLVDDLEKAEDERRRQDITCELISATQSLSSAAIRPKFLPLWQLSSALDAFLKHSANRQKPITPAMIRTLRTTLDLAETLCLPGLRHDLTTQPPVRLLAVDDDPLSQHALSLALRNALQAPDLAADGAAAMKLIEQFSYDVIFLDVEMPGMNGFELCAKIRETTTNSSTPVVFVTHRDDLQAQADAITAGGQDLMTKPFAILELSLKALTLLIHHRLQDPAGSSSIQSKRRTKQGAPEYTR